MKQLGDARVRGALPDSEESDIARFWPGGGSNWNLTTRVIVERPGPRSLGARAAVRAAEHRGGRCGHRQPDLEVHLQLLAAGHGDPLARRRQSGHRQRSDLAAVPGDPAVSRLPLCAADRHRRRDRGAAPVLRHRRHRLHAHRSTRRRMPLPAPMAALPPKPITRSFDSLSRGGRRSAETPVSMPASTSAKAAGRRAARARRSAASSPTRRSGR